MSRQPLGQTARTSGSVQLEGSVEGDPSGRTRGGGWGSVRVATADIV